MAHGTTGRQFKTAFILGAGLGTRLLPLTETCPKPLLDLNGRPVITYAMDHLSTVGVERFIINTHHLPEAYRENFPDLEWRGKQILLRHEPRLLDTAGGLKNIADLLLEDEIVICYNGDIIADFPLESLLRFHHLKRPEATLVLRSEGPVRNVSLDGEGLICDMRNTLGNPGVNQCLFTGIYAVETSLLKHIPKGRIESIVTVFLNRIRKHPGSIAGLVIDEGNWCDIGSVEEYVNLKNRLAERR